MKKFFAVLIPALFAKADVASAQLYTCTGKNDACTICDFFAMLVNVVGVLLKIIVPSAMILMIIVAGVIMILKQEDSEIWAKAKKILSVALIGALITYGGWLLVSVSLMGLNSFNKDTWWKFELVCSYCGDGILQSNEECEPGLSHADCNEFYKVVTKEEPVATEERPVIQDRCGTANGGKDLTDPGVSFDIVRAQEYLQGGGVQNQNNAVIFNNFFGKSYTCDEVCASRGQVCIGVGLTNVAVNRCVSVVHHIGNICEISENLQQGSGCGDSYRVSNMTCLEISSPCRPGLEPCGIYKGNARYDQEYGAVPGQSYAQFSVKETACYCQ